MADDKELKNPLIHDFSPLTPAERIKKMVPEIAMIEAARHPESKEAQHNFVKAALGISENEALLAPSKPPEKWQDRNKETKEKGGFLSWLGF